MDKESRKVSVVSTARKSRFSVAPLNHFDDDDDDDNHDPLEKRTSDVIRDAPTPPPSPDELESGKAGCNLFRERRHFVHPSYKEDGYQRLFTAKLILGNMCTYIPTVFIMIFISI